MTNPLITNSKCKIQNEDLEPSNPPAPEESTELRQLRHIERHLESEIAALKIAVADSTRHLVQKVHRRSGILKRIGELTVGQLETTVN